AAYRDDIRRSGWRAPERPCLGSTARNRSPARATFALSFVALLSASLQITLHGNFRRRIGFLELDTPIAQIGQHNRFARYRTAHEVARGNDLKLSVKVLDLCLAAEPKEPVDTIHAFL